VHERGGLRNAQRGSASIIAGSLGVSGPVATLSAQTSEPLAGLMLAKGDHRGAMGRATPLVLLPSPPFGRLGSRRGLAALFENGRQALPNWDCAAEAHFKRGEDRVSAANVARELHDHVSVDRQSAVLQHSLFLT
jgi:hypothetical protein